MKIWLFCLSIIATHVFSQNHRHDPSLAGIAFQNIESKDEQRRQTILWKNGDWQLQAPNPQAGLRSQEENNTFLSILTLRSQSALYQELKEHSATLQTQAIDSYRSLVLMRLDDIKQVDQLAIRSHREGGGMCGTIETFPLTHQLVNLEDQTLIEPIFHSRAVFEELPTYLSAVSSSEMRQTIEKLVQLGNRFHTSDEGIAASRMVEDEFAIAGSGISGFSLQTVTHEPSPQASVVARIEGTEFPDETVILGAHLDSIAGDRSVAPGADDNASGIASLKEMIRLIKDQQLTFKRSIEFHAYGAEEVGLIGSRYLAQNRRENSSRIAGMMQIDMNFWGPESDLGRVYLVDNHTSRNLRRRASDWLRQSITTDYEVRSLPFGATSDHKAWFDQGYPTLFAFENPQDFNPNIHSSRDTIDTLNNELLNQRITQLAFVYLAYTAGLETLSSSYDTKKSAIFTNDQGESLYLAFTEQNNLYHLAVSAPTNVTIIEYCEINDRESAGCKTERNALISSITRQDRNLFYSDSSHQFSVGSRWRIEAFDSEDQLIGMRQIQIIVPSSDQ